MYCHECDKELDIQDTFYSNINTARCKIGEHTGDIYYCDVCEHFWLSNFLSGRIETLFFY
jgi:hypothetical protein